MKRVIFFVLLIIMSLISYSQNHVVNPGFEAWAKSSKPDGWTTSQNCSKDSVNIKSGNYSCRHEGGTKYLGQTISIVPGKHYRLSFFYKTIITGSGNGCRIWCYWKDTETNNMTDPLTDDILRPSKYLKSEIWQEFTIDFIAPSLAYFFYLEVRTYQNSIAYFDDFIFEENVATNIPEDLIPELLIYPNPSHTYLIIKANFNLQCISIENLSGTILWTAHLYREQTATIPVSGLPDGLYILMIQADNKFITRKFIKK